MQPIIGITADHHENSHRVAIAYANAIFQAGGTPIMLPPILGIQSHFLEICDGFVFTGGNDPIMEEWNIQTHPNAVPVSQERQSCELALLRYLAGRKEVPVLGVCLGMQWMSLLSGGTIAQDLAEPHASNHKKGDHTIEGTLGNGTVHSHHHQAIVETGSLITVAVADDGVIEAVQDPNRHWYLGVQWHPERTEDFQLGQGLFNQLVQASAKECLA